MKQAVLGIVACGLWLTTGSADQHSMAGEVATQGAVAATSAATHPGDDGDAPRGRDGASRPRGGRAGKGGGDRSGADLTPKQIDELLAFTKENFPQMHERLVGLRQSNPALFNRSLNRMSHFMIPLMRTKTENPELAAKMIAEHKAQLTVDQLSKQYRETQDPARKQELREQLRKGIEAKFDARLDRQRTEIRSLQRRLDDARQNLAGQEKDKQKLIEQRLTELASDKSK